MARRAFDPSARYALFLNGDDPLVRGVQRLSTETYTRAVAMKLAEAERRKTGLKIYARRVKATGEQP